MAQTKPTFALDLSNDGIALWHRTSGGGWSTLGQVSFSEPDIDKKFAEMRQKAGVSGTRPRGTVVRIPRSEVLLSKIRVGVFEGDAAISHARKQIADLTAYSIDEVAYDLGDKGLGTMTPVGVVARQTLQEADEFARANGFAPIYFTTQYSEKEFPREPKFYLEQAVSGAKSMWFAPWVAAAAVGLTIGYFGYSTFIQANDGRLPDAVAQKAPSSEGSSTVENEIVVAAVTATTEDVAPDTTARTFVQAEDIAPRLPAIVDKLLVPEPSDAPNLALTPLTKYAALEPPATAFLADTTGRVPKIFATSDLNKTSALQIAEARRDLPEVGLNDEIVLIIQDDLDLPIAPTAVGEAPVVLASLTAPDVTFSPEQLAQLPARRSGQAPVPKNVQTEAERPAPPPSLVTADPGTLTPTPQGTLGPDNILIFAGTPSAPPPARPGTVVPEVVVPEIDPLAGFRPRLRPDGLAPIEPAAEEVVPQGLLALADPALSGFKPRLRPQSLAPVATAGVADEAETQTRTEPDILALADPALAPFKPRLRPTLPTQPDAVAGTVEDEAPVRTTLAEQALAAIEETQNSEVAAIDLLALADASLAEFKPRVRPSGLVPQDQTPPEQETTPAADIAELVTEAIEEQETAPEEPTLLALADPALQDKRARTRPSGLRTVRDVEPQGLLALADPSLSGVKARARPRNLRIIQKPDPVAEAIIAASVEDAQEPQAETEAAPSNTLASATRYAAVRSPIPKKRPARLARVVKRVQKKQAQPSGNDQAPKGDGRTRATARTPKSAVGTAKPAPGPTSTTVAKAATERGRINKSRIALVGIFGTPNKRRALVRLPTGRYVKVQSGDSVSGWKISAIGEASLRIRKGSRNQVLRIP